MKKYYLPRNEAARIIWFKNFKNKISTYTTELGLTPAQIAAVAADCDMYEYAVNQAEARKSDYKNIIEWKAKLSYSPIGTVLGAVPVPEVTPPPVVVPAGVFTRLAAFVRTIKGSLNYNPDMGVDLGIIGDEISFDPAALKPVLKIKLNTGGHPVIKYKKNKTDRLNLYVDRRDGQGLKFLATTSKSSFTDMHPLPGSATVPPTPGSPSPTPGAGTIATVWDYKGVYVIDDEEVGEVSDLVSITIGPGIV
ncbi:MAG: hypothetical protein AB7P01_10935 [Bacteroidia bacterium]